MSEEYLKRLELAETLVRRARDLHERAAFQEIAAIWRRLALRHSELTSGVGRAGVE